MKKDITRDAFFDGKIMLSQPKEGFRAGSDAVLLAAVASPCRKRVLDVGCGVGAASICFAYHNQEAKIDAIDIQEDLLSLAIDNVAENGFTNINLIKKCVMNDKPEFQTYNSVITNPPFFMNGHGIKSPNKIKQTANTGKVNLQKWVDFCFLSLKDKGDFTIIFIADRLAELLHIMHGKFGDIEIIPLYPKLGQDARRVIIKAKKNTKGITKLRKGIILHKDNGSSNIDEILREGKRYDI